MDPEGVGNDMRLLISDMAGRASIELKGRELGFDLDPDLVQRVTTRVKDLESRGYTFEAADASFELMLLEEVEGARPSYFDVESWRVITETRPDAEAVSEATVKLLAGGARIVAIGEGNGPVNALDHALRQAIEQLYPEIVKFELIDYKVRILDQGHGTDAITRVLIETSDGASSWVTVGVGHNVIEASWRALLDSLTFGLRRHGAAPLRHRCVTRAAAGPPGRRRRSTPLAVRGGPRSAGGSRRAHRCRRRARSAAPGRTRSPGSTKTRRACPMSTSRSLGADPERPLAVRRTRGCRSSKGPGRLHRPRRRTAACPQGIATSMPVVEALRGRGQLGVGGRSTARACSRSRSSPGAGRRTTARSASSGRW